MDQAQELFGQFLTTIRPDSVGDIMIYAVFFLTLVTSVLIPDGNDRATNLSYGVMLLCVADLLVFPSTSCSTKESMLLNNDRFFISHTLIEPSQKNVKHDRLVKHLNNCFSCFQVYSQFYKDYFQAHQEIRRTLANEK